MRESGNQEISAVITVYNKINTLALTVESLLKQSAMLGEICVIDDGSKDGSVEVIKALAATYGIIKPIFQENHGISYTLNRGIESTSGEFVIVVDADVVLADGWLGKIMPYFKDKKVAAVSGLIKLANDKSIWSVLGGYSVEYRQSNIGSIFVDHLTTSNIIYRRSVLDEIGLSDTGFHYGEDNDLSYRIINAGYRLVLTEDTFCLHYWPQDFRGFFRQRFNGAIGRARLLKKYPSRWRGDKVSNLAYFMELPLTALFSFSFLTGLFYRPFLLLAALVILSIYILQLKEIGFLLKKGKFLLGAFLPFFSLLRAYVWLCGILYFYIGTISKVRVIKL